MAFRFFSRKKIFPGVTLNMSKSGPSLSFGPRGFKHTIGLGGRQRTTVGLPGTGLHYSVQHGKKSQSRQTSTNAPISRASPSAPSDYCPDPALAEADLDRDFLRAVVAFQSGDASGAVKMLRAISGAADADWLRGIIHLRNSDFADAASALKTALDASPDLGLLTDRNGVTMEIALPLTPEVTAHIGPNPRATRLAYIEALQALGELEAAIKELKSLIREKPDDLVVVLSLAEIAFEADDGQWMKMSDLAQFLERSTPVPALGWAHNFYLARALERCERYPDAILAYEATIKDDETPEDMALLARYELALTFGDQGDRTRYRQELSAVHAIDRSFADVEARLKGRVV